MRFCAGLLPFLLGAAASPLSSRSSHGPRVTVKNGTYEGVAVPQYEQEIFFGMPYAEAPRFAAPKPLSKSWKGVRTAQKYGPSCPSVDPLQAPFKQSEDCLSVNVIRPIGTKPGKKLPVAVWVYGGAYQYGTTADPAYNTSFIAQASVEAGQPVIVVSINYRIGGFGFLSSAEVYGDRAANAGLKDQRLALHWIQENIAAFGGNPKRVTLWGHSAGGFAVAAQLLAYNGRNDRLFSQALIESGGPIAQFNPASYSVYQEGFNNLTVALKCDQELDTLACVRKAPYKDVLAAFSDPLQTTWYPVVDGDFVATWPDKQLENGRFVRVPTLQGTCSDEGTDFGAYDNATNLENILPAFGPNLYESSISQLAKLYPNLPALGAPYAYPTQSFFDNGLQYKRIASAIGDMFYIAPRRYFSQSMSKVGLKNYAYRWNTQTRAATDAIGVTHQSELGYVFNNFVTKPYSQYNYTDADYALGKLTSRMWVSFFATGDPNKHGLEAPRWTPYNKKAVNFVFNRDSPSVIEKDTFRKDALAYWQTIVKQLYRR